MGDEYYTSSSGKIKFIIAHASGCNCACDAFDELREVDERIATVDLESAEMDEPNELGLGSLSMALGCTFDESISGCVECFGFGTGPSFFSGGGHART